MQTLVLVRWRFKSSMEYVIMTLDEAKKVAKKDAIVLVSKQDLENQDCNVGFSKKRFYECDSILEEAAMIAKVCDDFSNQLKVFSEMQRDISKGYLHTILYKRKHTEVQNE